MINNSFNYINQILVASVIITSVITKISDKSSVTEWLGTHIKIFSGDSLFYLILIKEAILFSLILLYGERFGFLVLVIAFVLLLESILSKIYFGKDGGCPCFGSITLHRSSIAIQIFSWIFVASLVLYFLSIEFGTNVLFASLLGPLLPSCAFIYGRKILSTTFNGKAIKQNSNFDSFNLNKSRASIVVFASTGCQECARFIKYLEAYSLTFNKYADFYIVMNGFHSDEIFKFGGCLLLKDDNVTRRSLDINLTPSMVIIGGDKVVKYSGLHACTFGLSNLMVAIINSYDEKQET